MKKENTFKEYFMQVEKRGRVTSLNLSNQGLTAIPPELALFPNLRKLNLSGNSIKAIPRSIAHLKRLKVLNLSHNDMTQIHASVFLLPKLVALDVSHNQIKSLPKQLAKSSVTVLNISDNPIAELDYSLLSGLKRLIANRIKIDSFRPTIKLPFLEDIWLNGCNVGCSLNDPLMPELVHLYSDSQRNAKKLKPQNNIEKAEIKNSPAMSKKEQHEPHIFISYSHTDKEWLQQVKTHLRVLRFNSDKVDIWEDTQIKVGNKWKDEIEKALKRADAAILLVSADFLASDFIAENELPPILEKVRKQGKRIYPVIVSYCNYNLSPLKDFQALNFNKPLYSCSKVDVDKYLVDLVAQIAENL